MRYHDYLPLCGDVIPAAWENFPISILTKTHPSKLVSWLTAEIRLVVVYTNNRQLLNKLLSPSLAEYPRRKNPTEPPRRSRERNTTTVKRSAVTIKTVKLTGRTLGIPRLLFSFHPPPFSSFPFIPAYRRINPSSPLSFSLTLSHTDSLFTSDEALLPLFRLFLKYVSISLCVLLSIIPHFPHVAASAEIKPTHH